SGRVDQQVCHPFVGGPLLQYSHVLVQEQPRSLHFSRTMPDASGSEWKVRYMSTTRVYSIRLPGQMVVSRDLSSALPKIMTSTFGLRSSVHQGLCYGSATWSSIESSESLRCLQPASLRSHPTVASGWVFSLVTWHATRTAGQMCSGSRTALRLRWTQWSTK